ncbi:MAG: hypothetical protein QOF11_1372 [Chloroflexota bacterium]|jgi:hypothetical protein|nr:hypothetical protein [Chloroflexota bacterium]
MMAQRFPIRVGRKSRPLLRLFGVKDDNAYVDLDGGPGLDGDLDARFGYYRVRTPLRNIASWRIEGPWLWLTAIAVRTSLRHRDVTFGGSPHGGVRLNFKDPAPFAFYHIPALYLTVDDLEGLAAALSERGIPGEDARKRKVP